VPQTKLEMKIKDSSIFFYSLEGKEVYSFERMASDSLFLLKQNEKEAFDQRQQKICSTI